MKLFTLSLFFFSLFFLNNNSHAQGSWSEIDRNPTYAGIGNTISGASTNDGYLFLVENEAGLATLVKLSEEGDIVAERTLSTADTSFRGDLYVQDEQAYFVGYQIANRDVFSFKDWFEREKVQFLIEDDLELSQYFKSAYVEPNQFAFGSSTRGVAGIQEGQISTVSANGKLFRHKNSGQVQDTSLGFTGSVDYESIWLTYDLETGEQTERTLARRNSPEGQFEGVSDLLAVDSIVYLSANFSYSSTTGGMGNIIKLDALGNILDVESTDATTIFFSILYRMERSGDHILANKLILRDQEYVSVWEKRDLNFELLDERIETDSLLCPQERSLRSDGNGGAYALMGNFVENAGVTLKHIAADLSDLWSAELPSYGRNAHVMTAKDGGVIVFEARFDSVFVSRFSASGTVVSTSSTGLTSSSLFTGPNPTSDALHFTEEAFQFEGGLSVKVYSVQGQLILDTDLSHAQVDLPASAPAGIYVAVLTDRDGRLIAHRKVMYQP